MNTLENNKIIAEFMNKKVISEADFLALNYEQMTNDLFVDTTLNYHSDWNWLMEVVEKIESLGYFFKIVSQTSLIVDKDEKCISLSVYRKTKIVSTYEACVEFIKWYNEQQKN